MLLPLPSGATAPTALKTPVSVAHMLLLLPLLTGATAPTALKTPGCDAHMLLLLPQVLLPMLQLLHSRRGSLGVQGCSNTLWALARLGHDPGAHLLAGWSVA